METVADLERRLALARKREKAAAAGCLSCGGLGWIDDTTYDRTGSWHKCGQCHGTGLPAARVRTIIDAAMAEFLKARPESG